MQEKRRSLPATGVLKGVEASMYIVLNITLVSTPIVPLCFVGLYGCTGDDVQHVRGSLS
jgi:hypothetical protein